MFWHDCEAVLRDTTWSVDPCTRGAGSGNDAGFLGGMDIASFPVMLMLDPPDHMRLRRLVSKAFTPRTVERMRPRIEQILNEMLDDRRGSGSFDLIEAPLRDHLVLRGFERLDVELA